MVAVGGAAVAAVGTAATGTAAASAAEVASLPSAGGEGLSIVGGYAVWAARITKQSNPADGMHNNVRRKRKEA